jgi:LacI family transcriptional regulator
MSDVAKLAGVSVMTVSRVLNDSANVRDYTRQFVLTAIKKLRYQPNELARSLRDKRTRQVGVVLPHLFDPFFASCAHGINSAAKEHTYSIVLATSKEDPETEFLELSQMLRRNVEWLVAIPAESTGGAVAVIGSEI